MWAMMGVENQDARILRRHLARTLYSDCFAACLQECIVLVIQLVNIISWGPRTQDIPVND